jgi:hypothetical protein
MWAVDLFQTQPDQISAESLAILKFLEVYLSRYWWIIRETCLFNIQFNFILSSMALSLIWCLFFKFSELNFVYE